jgi:hypothetical protein
LARNAVQAALHGLSIAKRMAARYPELASSRNEFFDSPKSLFSISALRAGKQEEGEKFIGIYRGRKNRPPLFARSEQCSGR